MLMCVYIQKTMTLCQLHAVEMYHFLLFLQYGMYTMTHQGKDRGEPNRTEATHKETSLSQMDIFGVFIIFLTLAFPVSVPVNLELGPTGVAVPPQLRSRRKNFIQKII